MSREIRGEELRKYLYNVLDTGVDEEGSVGIRRFTEKQLRQYRADSSPDTDFVFRAEWSSSVVLEMVTDSGYIALEHDWDPAPSYPWEDIDFLVDGVETDHRYVEKTSYRTVGFEIPEGKHHIQIWFPWNARIRLEHVFVDDFAAVEQPAPKKHRILCFGDSITQGYIGHHPAFNYVGILSRTLNAECLNQAIGGYWFQGASLDGALADYHPDLITVAYGTNDYSLKNTFADFSDGVTGFVTRLKEIFPHTPVLGIMPIYRNDDRFRPRRFLRSYTHEEAMEEIRRCYRRYPDITILEDTWCPHTADFFAPDKLHPNDLGFSVYGAAVVQKAKEILSE